MKYTNILKVIVAAVTLMSGARVWAAECEEVVWNPSVLSKFPDIGQYCQGVIEQDGKTYVQLDARFESAHAGKAKFKFKHPDGSYGRIVETEKLSTDFRVTLDGKPTRIIDIPRNSQLTVYLPPDRFELVSNVEEPETLAVLYAYEEPAAAVLPETASSLPLLALVGGLFSLFGMALTVFRKLSAGKSSALR